MTQTKEHDGPPPKAAEHGPPATHKDAATQGPATKPVEQPDPTQSYLLGEKLPKPEDQAKAAARDKKDGEEKPATIITGQEASPTPWNSPGLVPPDQVGKPAMKPELTEVAEADKRYHPDPHTEHKDDPARGVGFAEGQPKEAAHAHGVAPHAAQEDDAAHYPKGGGAKK